MKNECADSKWTAILTDPYFEENAKYGTHIEDSLYAATYDAFQNDRFEEVKKNSSISALVNSHCQVILLIRHYQHYLLFIMTV
jgi:hypothetical protein